jgi:translation initiation factor 1
MVRMVTFDVMCADPFADDNDTITSSSSDRYIHIRIQQRNGRKTLTTVQGISSEFDLKKIVKVVKKVFRGL